MSSKTPKNLINTAIGIYLDEPVSLLEAASRVGIAKSTLWKEMRRRGLPRKSSHEIRTSYRGGPRVHSVNETYFDEIDSEEKAYWLGFIAADGCVTSKRLKIGLSSRDVSHLEKFRNALESSAPITIFGKKNTLFKGKLICSGPSAQITICSSKIVRALALQGIHEAKSATCKTWAGKPELMRHYWRGIVDGDGWIHKNKTGYYCVGLCGTKSMVFDFATFAGQLVDTKRVPSLSKNCNFIWNFSVEGMRMPQAILKELYREATVWLERKHLVANDLLCQKVITYSQSPRPDLDAFLLKDAYESGMSSCDLARLHGCSNQTILEKLRIAGYSPRKGTPWKSGRHYVNGLKEKRRDERLAVLQDYLLQNPTPTLPQIVQSMSDSGIICSQSSASRDLARLRTGTTKITKEIHAN